MTQSPITRSNGSEQRTLTKRFAVRMFFHYVYGLLHSEDYRQRFRANLAKELPRIPCVASAVDYRAFRDAGRRLGELHVGYESVDRYPAEIDTGSGVR